MREVLEAVERVTGNPVPHDIHPRRAGDPPELYADISMARELLGFKPQYADIETIVDHAWQFHRKAWGLAESPLQD